MTICLAQSVQSMRTNFMKFNLLREKKKAIKAAQTHVGSPSEQRKKQSAFESMGPVLAATLPISFT